MSDDGTAYIVHASKATILATGGFSGNPEMLRQYDSMWDFPEGHIPTTNAYGHTGDGIVMAQSLGAATKLMDQEMLFPFADFKNWSTETIVGDTGGCLFVNESGERFVNEVGSRFDICRALFKQPEGKGFIISDADNCKIVDGINQGGVTEEFLLERGQLFKADTLEELAELAGIEPAALTASVEKYNACVKAGVDEEFGRTVFSAAAAVDTPPFYASPRTWAAHITTGGLVIDTDYCVLDETGARIEGLYAAGEVVCGLTGVGVLGNGMECAQMLYQQ